MNYEQNIKEPCALRGCPTMTTSSNGLGAFDEKYENSIVIRKLKRQSRQVPKKLCGCPPPEKQMCSTCHQVCHLMYYFFVDERLAK